MSSRLTVSPKHKNLMNALRIDMEKNSASEFQFHPEECCIYRVPEILRNVNEEAYTPQMVSIGPFHHGNKRLAKMENVKRSYMKNFFDKITEEQQYAILNIAKENENKIRNCYSEISDLNSHEYIMMILYDAIFIIELFLKNFEKVKRYLEELREGTLEESRKRTLAEAFKSDVEEQFMRNLEEPFRRNHEEPFMKNLEKRSDSFLHIIAVKRILTSDLELLENQLPYFVLEEIYGFAFPSDGPSLKNISRLFIGASDNMSSIELTPEISVKHFTDWRRCTLLKKYPKSDQPNGYTKDVPCAMKLYESGVRFKKIEREGEPLKFDKRGRELQLPQLVIADGDERVLRNVMALEQCRYPGETHIGNFIDLMDRLIETEKDVDLLVGSGIISNNIGDNSSIANMFNKLGRNIRLSGSSYSNTCKELKKHYDNPLNKTMDILGRVYFSNVWRGTGTIAAIILLLFTVIQTICSILQIV